MNERPTRWRPLVLAASLSLFLVACGGGSGEIFAKPPVAAPEVPVTPEAPVTPVTPTPEPPAPVVQDGQATLTDAGGTVSIKDAKSPIFGAEVVIPPNSMPGATETISITYEDQLPGALGSDALGLGGTALGKVIVLTRTGTEDFGQAVTVRVPFDKNSLAPDEIPIVVTWDDTLQAYAPATLVSIDRTNGIATFMTSHFSRYALFVLKRFFGTSPASSQDSAVDVGFVPSSDGFFIHNFGTYEVPGGNAFAMAGYAAWYHKWIAPHRGHLATLYREGDPVLEEDDQTVRELVSRVYQLGNQKDHIQALGWLNSQQLATRLLADRFTGYSLLAQMFVTKQAQVLAMGVSGTSGWTSAQAVTVYAYDATKKAFLVYDPNFPGEVVELPWDPANGFGAYSKGGSWNLFAFASFNQAWSSATFRKLYNGAESGWASSVFPKITITSPTELSTLKGTYEVASGSNVTITGTVPRPASSQNPTAQRYVHVYLNGTKTGSAIPVGNSDDAFTITIAQLPTAAGTDVMLIVSESPKSWATAFTAFKQFRIRVAGQFFFRNLGFETGDFTSWASERHLWPDEGGTPVIPSDKSAIMASGTMDPHATDLPVSLYGTHSARINNGDDSYHISTVSQTAVVPNVANPVVKFYWAAVLEDPQHPPEDQPYVKVTVTNETKSTVLYERRFYSNDPSYSGWKSYSGGDWKSIPWQLVELPVATSIGDTLKLTVEAADCAQGGHGGYAYLDAEE